MVCDRLLGTEKRGPPLIPGERVSAGYEEDAAWATIVWNSSEDRRMWLEWNNTVVLKVSNLQFP